MTPVVSASTQAENDDLGGRQEVAALAEKAASGDIDAQIELGARYFQGLGVAQNLEKAASFYREAALRGDPRGLMMAGWIYKHGIGVPEDKTYADRWLTQLAEKGPPEIHHYLGTQLYGKNGPTPSDADAFYWIELAADGDFPAAQVDLAGMYADGRGVAKDASKAMQLYTRAADQGDDVAQFMLGLHYRYGKLLPTDVTKAKEWLTKSANQGNPVAQYELADLYLNGLDSSPDWSAAAIWLRRAASQAHPVAIRAQAVLAAILLEGLGVPRDEQEAARLFSLAAEQGHVEAQYMLGHLYKRGIGVKKDNEKALAFYLLASESGHKEAAAEYVNLASEIEAVNHHASEQGTKQSSTDAREKLHATLNQPPAAVDLTISAIDALLKAVPSHAERCAKFGLTDGASLLWAPYSLPPQAANASEEAVWTYHGCFLGLPTTFARLGDVRRGGVLDVERLERDGFPVPTTVQQLVNEACGSLEVHPRVTALDVNLKFRECVPLLIEYFDFLLPYVAKVTSMSSAGAFGEAIMRLKSQSGSEANQNLRLLEGAHNGGNVTQDLLCVGFLARSSGLIEEVSLTLEQRPPEIVAMMKELSTVLLAKVAMQLDDSKSEMIATHINNGIAVAEPSGRAVEITDDMADKSHWRYSLVTACAARAE